MKIFMASVFAFLLFLCFAPLGGFAENQNASNSNPSQSQNAPVTFGDSPQEGWDPYVELERMRQDFNRLLQFGMSHASRGLDWAQNQSGLFNPQVDLVEEKDRYLLKADIPGMDKSKLDVKITDNHLKIAGERLMEKAQGDEASGVYQQERSFGRFERTIPVPANVEKEKISAKYDLGVLTIELPKINPSAAPSDNSRKIEVK